MYQYGPQFDQQFLADPEGNKMKFNIEYFIVTGAWIEEQFFSRVYDMKSLSLMTEISLSRNERHYMQQWCHHPV